MRRREGNGPSERVVEQRVRNRVIEYLELTSSLAAQADYEKSVPIAYVPYEVINQWEDQLPRDLTRSLNQTCTRRRNWNH